MASMPLRAMYKFEYVRGHVEVFLNGKFQFSADTMGEALREAREPERSVECEAHN